MREIKVLTIKEDEESLRSISSPVEVNDPELNEDIEVLSTYCAQNEVMAMAAVQLGIPKRLVYLKNTNIDIINRFQKGEESQTEKEYNEQRVLINPVITAKEGLTEYWEACASGGLYCGKVQRPYKIEISYQDEDFNYHKEVIEGFPATVLSHEMDHLDGILHMDVSLELLELTPEDRKVFRQTHGYKVISQTGDYESQREPIPKRELKKTTKQ